MHLTKGVLYFITCLIATVPLLLFSASASEAAVYLNQPLVNLSWSSSGAPDTKGYEVHRSTTYNGVFTKISATLIEASTWTDSNVADGSTYYYKLTAIDTCGNVSGLSIASDAAVIDLSAPSVSANPPGGTYRQSVSVMLEANEPSTIYYTTDGSVPTTSSAVFSAPIILAKSTVLKYIAVDRASNKSQTMTSTYTLDVGSIDADDDGYDSDIDCDDTDPLINPGASEACGDFVDNDCDALVDEGCDDLIAPAYIDNSLFPFPGNGIDDDVIIPPDTTIRLRLVDGAGLDICEEIYRTSITASAVYIAGGEEFFEPLIGETKFKVIDEGDCTDAWIVFVPDFENAYGDGLPVGGIIEVVVEASDVFGNYTVFFEGGSYRFRVSENDPLPSQSFEDPNPSADGNLVTVTLLEGPNSGVFMQYPDSIMPAPYFGPPADIPGLPGSVTPVLPEPVNLQPPCVFFNDEFSLFIPLPDGAEPASFEVWRFDAVTGWEAADSGDDWLVNRINHASYPAPNGPPTVELIVSHFTGAQLATASVIYGGGGGGSASCFIATAAYGSALEKDVMILRQFRDTYLLPNVLGKELVEIYYRTSPGIAQVIARHEMLRAVTRTILMPIVWVCKLSLETPARAIWLLMTMLMGVICAGLLTFRIRKKRFSKQAC
ncbi:MAG: hypothetical protein C4520_20785 [Candidatus Abyssobacteria bacterium SURF_5]|uniref:GH29D-like beta-sandwich domain-containing protein n=1 Tax=Abyssobacteria bacterium (strain SURF_5) TaxID=2093360 RepID=A0A3A4MYN6_ABYX5|nr:MAG: hypothetical protein C4520_20785 [Candidatus Abyssubacteria bacterium SURF_5]